MRALLWIVLAAAAVWGGYWWVGSSAVERGVNDWFAQQTNAGLVAQNDSVTVAGFPNRFDLTVEGLNLSDPGTGLGWKAPFLQVFTMTWKPWHLIAAFAPGQQIVLPDQTITIDGTGMKASAQVHPDSDLGLYETRLEATALTLGSSLGWTIAADKLFASTLEMAPTSHRMGLSVANLTPVAGLAAGSGLPEVIETVHLDATADLTAPLDRRAGDTKPQLTRLSLADVRLIWGPLQITATGALDASFDGLAEGEIAIKIAGWRHLPQLLSALGVVGTEMAPSIERGLEVMAQAGSDPEVLVVNLTCKDGQMHLGPFPLGPAPPLH